MFEGGEGGLEVLATNEFFKLYGKLLLLYSSYFLHEVETA